MSKEVLLMSEVPGLGAEGDVVTVKDGYARNYLLPKKLAAPVTAATRRQLEKLRREREARRKQELQAAQELANRLSSASVTIPVKTGKDAKLYGSVTGSDIATALEAQGVSVDRHKFAMEEPIRELGVYHIKIKLHPDVEASVKVWVVEE
jgi:large subunit ribosomal protein L9